MPRRLRIHLPGGFYHVTLRGNHQQDIFVCEGDRHLLNTIVARAIEKFGARLHAYCWMRNHIHLLLQVGAESLARPMRQIAAEFARAMQAKLATTGHFFERRYHATLVDVDSYFLELIRYIHLNPVRARVVTAPVHFRWSSHHVYLGTQSEPWVTTDFVLSMFGKTRAEALRAYRAFLAIAGAECWEPSVIRVGRDQAVLGSDTFLKQVGATVFVAKNRQTLAELIAEACQRFGIEADALAAPARDKSLSWVRAWIAHQSISRHIACLATVARALARDESTLREAMRRYAGDLE
jgi:putative transposase